MPDRISEIQHSMRQKRLRRRRNKVLLIIILVFIIVFAVIILGFYKLGAGGVTAKITPHIRYTELNVAVLNDVGTFEILIHNHELSSQTVTVQVIYKDKIQNNYTFQMEPNSTRTEIVSQKLSDLGSWKVEANSVQFVDSANFSTLLDVYSFEVKNVADTGTDWIKIFTFVIAAVSLFLAVVTTYILIHRYIDERARSVSGRKKRTKSKNNKRKGSE